MTYLRPTARLLIAVACIVALAAAGAWWFRVQVGRVVYPAPETIVTASLEGLREQNRLSAFVASYVAVVTARQQRFGLSAERTLVMPGLVRYEVDLARLRPQDVRWDGQARILSVVLPPIEIAGPQVDLTRMRQYDGGGLLLKFGATGDALDQANRRAGQAELIRQARESVPVNLAKDATRRAVERSFALPLRATGLDATVRVRFPDEPDFPPSNTEQMDRSRSLKAVLGH